MENKQKAILEGLNAEQKTAVESTEGPMLIVAGAGSGKTRVLTGRVAYMLAGGGDPSRILALTFTKKAATEMKERIAGLIGRREAWKIWMGTFHSIFIRFLREYADVLGYPQAFTIYDTSDSLSAVKACIKELGLDDKYYKPKEILTRISLAKNDLVTAEAYRNDNQRITADVHSRKPRVCDIYSLYSQKCRNSGVMDYDDILLNMNILLHASEQAGNEIASRFDYILVDEYQDTNLAQYKILRYLAKNHHNICVVGDDSQSIYAFRGAKIENILNFRKDYPECKVVRLEKNYRSTGNIVNAANSLIAKNANRLPKTCVSVGEEGDKIMMLRAFNAQDEAVMIASAITERMMEDHAAYRDFAILYRTNSQSRALEEVLRKRNLPYAIYSGHSFFERAEVKDMMAYFKLTVNVNDDESFKRVVNVPARGIGETSVAALSAAARSMGCSLFKASYSEDLAAYGLKPAAITKIRAFSDMIDKFAKISGQADARTITGDLSDACGLYAYYKGDTSIEGQSRASNVEELLNSVYQFVEDRRAEYVDQMLADGVSEESAEADCPAVTLGEFIENVSLLSNVDLEDEDDASNKIALMTVHSAKGLEFPYVFVAGMEENLFPSGGMLASPADIEEERRLFYVAMTRAKKAVYLSFARSRMRNGKTESNSPSRFVREIDRRYVANPLPPGFGFGEGESAGGYASGQFGGFGDRSGYPSSGRMETRSGSYAQGRGGSSSFGPGYGRNFQSSGQRPSGQSMGRQSYGAQASGTQANRQAFSANPSRLQTTGRQPSGFGTMRPQQGFSQPKPPQRTVDSNFVPEPMTAFKAGQRIEHSHFGKGVILEIMGEVPELKAKVRFDDFGEKMLLLRYAKMRFEG